MNRSRTYLLPLIAPLIGIKDEYFNLIENTYLFLDEDMSPGKIHILQNFSFKVPEYTSYEHEIIDNQYFDEFKDFNGKVLYSFKFPEEYLPEYHNYIDSKFSKFGTDAKEEILDFWTRLVGKTTNGVNTVLKIKHILNKDKTLKAKLEQELSSRDHKVILDEDAELGSKVKLENEIFKLDEYKLKKTT